MPNASQPIGKLLEGWLAHAQKQQKPLFEVQKAWSKIVGKPLAAHTKAVSVRKGKLVIHVDRPGENFELSYDRECVLKRVKKITQNKVTEIVVRAGKI